MSHFEPGADHIMIMNIKKQASTGETRKFLIEFSIIKNRSCSYNSKRELGDRRMSELKNLFDSLNIPEEKLQELINSGNNQPDDGPTAFRGT